MRTLLICGYAHMCSCGLTALVKGLRCCLDWVTSGITWRASLQLYSVFSLR